MDPEQVRRFAEDLKRFNSEIQDKMVALQARFNALGLVAAILLVWAYLAWTYGRVTGRQIRSWQHHRWAAVVTLSLVAVWFVVRNIPFPPFSALHV